MLWMRPLRDATLEFAGVLTTGDLTAPVPSCPGWSLADLGNHLRHVHLWAAHAIAEGTPDGTSEPVAAGQLADAYLHAADHLLDTMGAVGEDAPAWTFGSDTTVAFWWRRQTHEVTLHLYDALLSQGRHPSWQVPTDLAWDGVDEVASMFYPRQVRLGRTDPLTTPIRLTATDLDRSVVLGEGEPTLELAAPAAELLLTLWKRLPPSDPEVAAVLAAPITP